MDKKDVKESNLGLIHVITGDGKGKTTSALGLALRAAGHGFHSLIIQFMKKGWDYGELKALQNIPEISILQFGTPEFVDKENPKKIDLDEAKAALDRARIAITNEKWNILILDEIIVALDFKLISEKQVIDVIKQKPKNLELVLTGREASNAIIELADYYTEICEHKHPYQRKILARKGVEY
ncbi:MAG: cob(I)yrinic acid a,c-diamide adenosyltransferase [Candidatus Heimdallarchaeota archaeon]|nr:MAG: cob(I)yrinic acid a,c-diamide adenosyltransferase [Candidatus Heimdallarchaeota archaeon]